MANKTKSEEVKTAILNLLIRGPAGITDIVKKLDMYSHLTTRKYVHMLEQEGIIKKDENKKYSKVVVNV